MLLLSFPSLSTSPLIPLVLHFPLQAPLLFLLGEGDEEGLGLLEGYQVSFSTTGWNAPSEDHGIEAELAGCGGWDESGTLVRTQQEMKSI